MLLRRRSSTSGWADNGIVPMRKNHSFLACAQPAAMKTSIDINGMEDDHRAARALHDGVEQLYESWMTAGLLHEQDQEKLSSMTRQLEQLYQQHIRLEEQVVFPLAARVLEAETIAQMGEEFRVRREQAAGPTILDQRRDGDLAESSALQSVAAADRDFRYHSPQQITYCFFSARFNRASNPVLISAYSSMDNVPLSFSLSIANNSSLRMPSKAVLPPVAAGDDAGG